MSDFGILLVSACSILVPFTVAVVRYRHFSYRFAPFWFLLLAGTLNELVSYATAHWLHSNQVNANCYTLIEFLLLLWLFQRIGTQKTDTLVLAVAAGLLIWFTDNIGLHGISHSNVLFRISSSVLIVYFSIDEATRLLLAGSANACQKTDLTICLSFFVYHTYRSFILLFSYFAAHPFSIFSRQLWLTLAGINILIHLTYTLAILWIPKQPLTSVRYS